MVVGNLISTLLLGKRGIGSARYDMRTSMMAAATTTRVAVVTMELGIMTA
jgi:hypothetical protein